jgi:glycosyltransferase involved in cell wall biosynthesis
MRLLFIGMPDSIHTARWISQLTAEGWDIYLFPSLSAELHRSLYNSSLYNVKVFSPSLTHSVKSFRNVRCIRWTGVFMFMDNILTALLHKPIKLFWKWALILIIRVLKPDLVQSLEMQLAGYLTMSVHGYFSNDFPKWIVTNWGSDIYLFGRFPEHAEKIRAVLGKCDYYSAECQRDIDLAREKGFKGKALLVFPNAGGFDLEHVKQLREPGNTSARRIILLKGYQHWAGRALVGVRALAMCADVLHGYTVAIYAAAPDVEISAKLFSHDTGIPVEFVPSCSHDEMLRWYGRARIYIGLSISDAISTSMLEAIVMGAFPIQSNTSCADEWVTCGEGGFIVPAEDPEIISKAIREAVLKDSLVDNADEINKKLARERLDESIIKPQVVEMYKQILAEKRE